MKNIKNFKAAKYLNNDSTQSQSYKETEPDIYECKEGEEVLYVTFFF